METKHWIYALFVVCIAAAGTIRPAVAQDEAGDDGVVVEVDENGRVLVDGEPVADGDGQVVVRIQRDGRVAIEGRRRGARRTMPLFRRDGFEPPNPTRMRAVEPVVDRLRMEFGGIGTLVEEHLEVAGLERESRELAAQARRASDEDRDELEAQLREKLDEIFAKKMELRRERLSEVEARLQEQRAELQERDDAQDEIIQRRFQELLGESDAIQW